MLARHDGQVVLVAGAIPGERVRARIERVNKGMAFATTLAVIQPSPARREAVGDPLCGGTVYAHVAYAEQAAIKREVLRDALRHGGRIEWPGDLPVSIVTRTRLSHARAAARAQGARRILPRRHARSVRLRRHRTTAARIGRSGPRVRRRDAARGAGRDRCDRADRIDRRGRTRAARPVGAARAREHTAARRDLAARSDRHRTSIEPASTGSPASPATIRQPASRAPSPVSPG